MRAPVLLPQHITMEAREASRRLAVEFPDMDPPRIESLMSQALCRILNTSIESFRVVLAERSVQARLRALAADRRDP
jgi:hypothetical protein